MKPGAAPPDADGSGHPGDGGHSASLGSGGAVPELRGQARHAALTEPAAFVRYWVDHGVLPADHQAPHGVVLLYQRSVFDAVLAAGRVTPFAPRGRRGSAFLDLHLLDATDGTVGVIGGFGIGAPAAVATMESLAAIGVRSFIGIGTAGALRRGLDTGDVVVCDRAVRDEGVSHHYLPPAMFADASPTLTAQLTTALTDAGLAPTTASAWTIDAPFRETVVEARHYADEGVAVVEMEAAALFAVGAVRGVDVASAFTISDSLADGEWVPQFGHRLLAERLDAMVAAAVTALPRLGYRSTERVNNRRASSSKPTETRLTTTSSRSGR